MPATHLSFSSRRGGERVASLSVHPHRAALRLPLHRPHRPPWTKSLSQMLPPAAAQMSDIEVAASTQLRLGSGPLSRSVTTTHLKGELDLASFQQAFARHPVHPRPPTPWAMAHTPHPRPPLSYIRVTLARFIPPLFNKLHTRSLSSRGTWRLRHFCCSNRA